LRVFVFADLDFERDLEADRTEVLFFELCGDLSRPYMSLVLFAFTFTLYDARAEVIKSARYFDLAFSAIFVR